MLDALNIVATLLAIMVVGYFVSKKGWITPKTATFISKIVVNIGVPAAALDNLLSNFDKAMLADAGVALGVPFLIVGACFMLGILLARLFVKPGSRGVFATLFACSNTIFVGLPVCQALLGADATIYVLLYDLGHTMLFWTVGAYLMQRDGELRRGEDKPIKLFSMQMVKKVLSPGLIGLVLAIVLVLLNIKLPSFALKSFSYLGKLCTPLALIYIGHVLARNGLKSLRVSKGTWGVLLGRVLIAPAIAYGLMLAFGAPMLMSQTYVAQAAMPVMTSTALVAAEYGADDTFATEAMTVTMFVSCALLPILSWFLQTIV